MFPMIFAYVSAFLFAICSNLNDLHMLPEEFQTYAKFVCNVLISGGIVASAHSSGLQQNTNTNDTIKSYPPSRPTLGLFAIFCVLLLSACGPSARYINGGQGSSASIDVSVTTGSGKIMLTGPYIYCEERDTTTHEPGMPPKLCDTAITLPQVVK